VLKEREGNLAMNFFDMKRAIAIAAVTVLIPMHALASDPSRPIQLIVPTPPGSASDALARAMSVPWGRASGRPLVVENIAGAGTTIGTARLVRAAKDGLTLGVISANHTMNPWLYKKLPYDVLADITPIAMLGSVPAMLVARSGIAAGTPAELIRLSKSSKTPLVEGVVSGTSYQIASEVFKDQADIATNRIPYKGSAEVVNGLLAGTLDVGVVAAQIAVPLVAAGKLKGLAVTGAARMDSAPAVPTLVESGFPKYSVDVWLAIAGPAGLSAADVAARRKEIELVLADPEMKKVLERQGVQPIRLEQNEILPFLKRDLERNGEVIRRVGITID
jgi:tripartite-type tricarboxylate transporter receptor subunit TctC